MRGASVLDDNIYQTTIIHNNIIISAGSCKIEYVPDPWQNQALER